jgi:hypothetical protein
MFGLQVTLHQVSLFILKALTWHFLGVSLYHFLRHIFQLMDVLLQLIVRDQLRMAQYTVLQTVT